MSKSTHILAIKGKAETAGAFNAIKSQASAAGANIRRVVGGAIAAAGAYMSVRAVSDATKQLGYLSDISAKTGASVESLTSTIAAFEVAGLNISMDQLVKSFQYLEKTTGEIGEDAFYKAMQNIAAIKDPIERGNALMRTFGRSALELQPLINGGEEVVQKFRTLQTLMPRVTTSAANAGDAVADAQTILGKGVSAMWQNVIGHLCELWGDEFPGGVRAGALNAVNYVEYMFKLIWHKMTKWGTKIAAAGQALFNFAANGYTWEQAWSEFGEVNAIIDSQMGQQLAAIDKARADYKANLATMNVDDLANAFGNRNARAMGESVGDAAANAIERRAQKITNALIIGETNAANKLAMFGPEYQNEAKKQTELLTKIAENTASSEGAEIKVANLGG